MADTFGLKIGLEGEKQFRQQLREIDQTFKVLGSEMKLVESQFDKNDKSAAALAARNEVLGKSIEAQKGRIQVMRDALDNAARSFGENDSRTKAWQARLNDAQAELNRMERQARENAEAIDSMGDEMQDSAKKADRLGDEVEESGEQSEDAKGKFSALGSVAAGVGVALAAAFAAVSAAAIKAGKALIQMSRDGAAYADNVLTASTVTGISTQRLQEYMYAAELVDVSVDTLSGSMRKNIAAMKGAASGTGSAAAAYAKLGVSVTNSDGSLRDSEEVYWEVIEALGNVENETERDALAMEILGKSAQDLNPLIEAGSDRMRELAQEANKAGYVLSDDLLAAYRAFDDQLQKLSNGATAAKNALGTVLLPILTQLAGEGVELLGEFTRGIQAANGDLSKIGDVVGAVLPKALDAVMRYVPSILDLIKTVLISIGKAIVDNLDLLIDSATQIVLTILNALIEALPRVAEGALKLILTLAKGLLDNLPAIISAVVAAMNSIVETIAAKLPTIIGAVAKALEKVAATIFDNLPSILKATLELIKGIAKGILQALPTIIRTLPTIIQGVVDFLVQAIPEIISAVIEIVMAVVNALPEIIRSLIEALPQIIQSIIGGLLELIPQIVECVFQFVFAVIDALPEIIEMLVGELPKLVNSIIYGLLSNIPKIIETGVKLFISLIEKLPEVIVELVKHMPEIISALVKGLAEGIGDFFQMGANLVRGLWEGIQSLAGWIWDKVSNWAQDLWNGILNFFGIHSPSRKFAYAGSMMMKGLGEGIGKGAGFALDKADEAVREVDDAFAGIGRDLIRVPVGYDVRDDLPTISPAVSSIGGASSGASAGSVTVELRIDNFNNYSSDDIESLTEQVLGAANAYLLRKGAAY